MLTLHDPLRSSRLWLTAAVIAVSALLAGTATLAEESNPGVAAIEEWVSVVDEGDFVASWKTAGPLFQAQVTQDQWVGQLEAVRTPLGAMKSRVEKSTSELTQLPGAPDGQYVVMQFDTTFANRAGSVETITAMEGEDGQWAVVGYFIK